MLIKQENLNVNQAMLSNYQIGSVILNYACDQGKKIKSKQNNKVSLNDFSTRSLSVSTLEKTSGSQTPESPISDLFVPALCLRPGLQLEASVSQPSMPDLQLSTSSLQLPTSGLQPDF